MVLFLNDIGTGEVLLILVFILIFFGSKSIPGLARTMGRTIRQIKDASNDLQSEIRKSSNELKGDLNLKEIIDDTARDIQRPLDQYAADIEDVMKRKPTNSLPKQKVSKPAAPSEPLADAATPKMDTPVPPVVKPKQPGTSAPNSDNSSTES